MQASSQRTGDITINIDCKLHALSSVYISNILCDNFIVTFYLISIYVNKGYMIFQEAFSTVGCVIMHKEYNPKIKTKEALEGGPIIL